jgi:hypothetical protein
MEGFMDWSSPIGVGIIGLAGLLTIALAIFVGNVVMNALGDDEPTRMASLNKSQADEQERVRMAGVLGTIEIAGSTGTGSIGNR